MEYWIVYDLATGTERWRGSGVAGAAAGQVLPEGLGIVLVPSAALEGETLDLNVLRNTAAASIDAQAEVIRQSILTPGAGQAMTYQRKEAEARAWSINNMTATPFLSAEAGAREMTIADLAAEIIKLADAWVAVGAAIEGLRMGAKAAVGRAPNLGAIVAAGRVNWSVLNG